jgi:hypothetical protein
MKTDWTPCRARGSLPFRRYIDRHDESTTRQQDPGGVFLAQVRKYGRGGGFHRREHE